jgi:putative hydrolase of the HAD superfamily
MPNIRALFWDVGGVLLTNAWDHEERDLAVTRFQLDKAALEARHKELFVPFEQGKMTLDQYLDRAIFYEPRTFSGEEFKQFMFSLSKPKAQALELARNLSPKYMMGTINNESRELNEYRIETFRLADIFDLFVTSCYVGIRKPDERVFRLALDLSHHAADECCFLDDRPENIEGAGKLGFHTVLVRNSQQMQQELQSLGVQP